MFSGEDETNTDKLVEYVQLNNAALRGKRALEEWREQARSRDTTAIRSGPTVRQCMGAMACISLTGAAMVMQRASRLR